MHRFYLITGEKSGEHYGAKLVNSIRALLPNASFYGFGGKEMEEAGVELSRRTKDLAIIGFVEVIAKLSSIRKNFKTAKNDISRIKPDAVILIDYPGFNLRMAKWAKKRGFSVYYYIAPQTWAWKRKRNKILANYVDCVFSIFPFEEKQFVVDGVPFKYVGHPMVDDVNKFLTAKKSERKTSAAMQKTIAVLPGSRPSEVQRLTTELLEVIRSMKDYKFLVAAMSDLPEDLYGPFNVLENVEIRTDEPLNILAESDLGLIKSGTSTLQAALLGLPQVVFYRVNPISGWIMRQLALIDYVSLPNLILEEPVVAELLQKEFTAANITREIKKLTDPEMLASIRNSYQSITEKLSKTEATAELVAKSIVGELAVKS